MKQLTCHEIGGPCHTPIRGETPGEIARAATAHIIEMAKTDPAHEKAYVKMEDIYNDQDRHAKWEQQFKHAWDAAPTVS